MPSIVFPVTFKVLHTGYVTSRDIRWNIVILDDTPYSLFLQVAPLELSYIWCILIIRLLPVRLEVVALFQLASGATAVHPELEFTLYVPGAPDTLGGLGVSGYELFFLLMFIGHKSNFKVGLSPVGAYYAVGILLSNVYTCYWGSATGVKFNCNPPTIHEYLHF